MKKLIYLGLCVMVKAISAQDSLDIKIGQMILLGFSGAEVDVQLLSEIRQGKAGSVILFEKNIPKSSSAFTALKKIIWTYQHAAPIPLFITIDQEGGRVNRLKDRYGFPRTITAREMGHSDDSTQFYAEAIASTLSGLGINVNLAPCVDLGINPSNSVIYAPGRAFSSDPLTVARRASVFINAHRKMGVITVLKHFPGHGSSMADSHYGMADVTQTWTEAELIPFRQLIEQGLADAVMTAHIVNQRLDPSGLPGTLSRRMVDSLLRRELGFQGVIFSDDMQMQAITKHYGLEEAIRLAIEAGVDILCFSNNMPDSEERTADKVHRIIRAYVEKGIIPTARIDASFRRILALKNRMRAHEPEWMEKIRALKEETATLKEEVNRLSQELDQMKTREPAFMPHTPKKRKKKK